MNRYTLTTLLTLLILVLLLPIYALREPVRQATALAALQQKYIAEGTELYLDNCAHCHGPAGEGSAAMPALANPALAEADPKLLFKSIARAIHGSVMAAWHVEEGGLLNDYQINELVTLIQEGDWADVQQLAEARAYQPPAGVADTVTEAFVQVSSETDPHECAACHEEPAIHADRFGLDCVRCHSLTAWTPGLLTRHTFALDHGGGGPVACQTCHTDSYASNSCYGCHDNHQAQEMETFHQQEGLYDITQCERCHPTGAAGEADQLRQGIQAQQ